MSWYSPLYWLSIRPLNLTLLVAGILAAVCLVCLVVGFVLPRIVRAKNADAFTRMAADKARHALYTMGIVGLVLVFCSYERVSFFGGRFWYVLWVIGAIVWKISLLYFAYKRVPVLRADAKKHRVQSEYLPPRKKKRNS